MTRLRRQIGIGSGLALVVLGGLVATTTVTATNARTTTHYVLTISAKDHRQVLRRLPDGKPRVLRETWHQLSGKTVSLGIMIHSLGDPGTIRYRVKATRERLDGTPASSDIVPNTGAMAWGNMPRSS